MTTTGRRHVLAVALWAPAVIGGCPADTATPDAAPADAASGDAAADAGACPGGEFYEVRAIAWRTGDALAGVAVTEIGDDRSDTTGADGLARICLPQPDAQVVHEAPDLMPWRANVDGDVAATAADAGDRFRVNLLSELDADEVFVQELGVVRDPDAAHVVVDIRAYPGGDPLEGARARLVDVVSDGPFAGVPGNTFGATDTLSGDEGEILVFANAVSAARQVELAVTPPASFTCQAPDTAPIEEGTFTYIPVTCTPAE